MAPHPAPRAWRAMIATDLDGTLLDSRARLAPANRAALEDLGARGVLRVIATGRNLASLRTVVDAGFPVDYVVFASGAGVLEWPSGALVGAFTMRRSVARAAVRVLRERELDFMLHHAIPDNHRFHYYRAGGRAGGGAGGENPDFDRRLARYADAALPWDEAAPDAVPVSQLVAIEPGEAPRRLAAVERALACANVVRTTSPLDHRSRWIEIFPAHVSKARAADRLRRRARIALDAVRAVGNDWNDRDMLEWAPRAAVVANAPAALRRRFPVVATNDEGGFAEAVAGM